MCLIREEDIIAWKNYNNLEFIQCACRFTQDTADKMAESKRLEVRRLIAAMKETNPVVDSNIYQCTHNVKLDTMIGWDQDGVKHHFLDQYDLKTTTQDD